MVYPLGADREATEAQMVGPQRIRLLARLETLTHDPVLDLSEQRMSGSVQVQAARDGVTRSLSLDLFDPTDVLGLSTSSTQTAGMNRLIRVWRGIYVDALGRWVDVPVFCGPISKPSRQGDVLSLEAQDKAALALDTGSSYTVRKGWSATGAIRRLMTEFCGETRFRIEVTSSVKLGYDYVVGGDVSPWQVVQRIASLIGCVAFYDGAGYLVVRKPATTPVYGFRAGPGGALTGGVQIGYWDREIYNRVIVKGGTISKVQITATATLNAAHPLAPGKLARNGKGGVRTKVITDRSIKSFAAAVARAKDEVNALAVQQLSATGEALPIWHLQEYDPITVEDPQSGLVATTRLNQATIPLNAGTMSVGYVARTARSRLAARVAPKSKKLRAAERRDRKAKIAAAKRKRAAAARKKRAAARRKKR